MEYRRLSTRQTQILEFIRQFVRDHAYPPSVREIGDGVGITSTSVVDYNLRVLAKRGYIRRDPDISRGIEILDNDGERLAERVSVPVMGQIAAGAPIEAIEGHAERVTLTQDLVPTEGVFALRVRGKSMIEDLIDDGDLVIVRPQDTADNGAIVVALINDGPGTEGQVTLKRIYREKDRIRLQPANATMEPIYVRPDQVKVQGQVVCLIRQMN
ncbi:MAG TPA: transcriptional repressor LexA [Chloroflexota bacterium]|nr:transcriptional repressor LexA [Chloroflexota bacterium]